MKGHSVLFLGCGDIAIRAGKRLLQQGWQVAGVRRNSERLPPDFAAYSADYTRPGSLDFLRDAAPEFVVTTLNPFDRSLAGYRAGFERATANLLAGLDGHLPRHIFMASSTRVYAEAAGGWVDEDSPLSEDDPWAGAIIAAERLLQDSPIPASIIRFAGIYGHGGGRLLARVSRGEICPAQPVRYTNRIHREDCSGLLCHLLEGAVAGRAPAPLYIGADDLPAPRHEVEQWLARRLGVAVHEAKEEATEPTRHNSAGHKRCRNRALHDSGYRLRYPDYRSGYDAVLSAG